MESKVGKLKTKAKSPNKVDVYEKSVGHACMSSDTDSDEYEMEVESEGETSSGYEFEANTETDTTETEGSVDLSRQVWTQCVVGDFLYTGTNFIFIKFFCYRLPLVGTNLQTEPKYVAFLSHLLLLFKMCQACKHDNPEIEIIESGTNVSIESKCPSCKQDTDWHSQPYNASFID